MKFSQRIGIAPLVKGIQIDDIDEDLKNGLWNIFNQFVLDRINDYYDDEWNLNPSTYFSKYLWHNFFKKTFDSLPSLFSSVKVKIRDYFFTCNWFEIYDFLEFSIELVDKEYFNSRIDRISMVEQLNQILEREFSAYRFIDGSFSPISNHTEINEIEESLSRTANFSSLKGCNIHLKAALAKLSDRLNPDYRNSIKESISAVESIAKIISNNSNDSLGASLDKIKGQLKIHPALERGFKQIYGYTSDTDGIRHALMDESTCDFEDAKFMLVSCSAFINYLIAKTNKAGIKF